MSTRRIIAGMPFHFVGKREVIHLIERWRREGRSEMIVVNNPNAVMLCHDDPQMGEATLRAGLALPDGVGVVVAALLLGYGRQHRVTGPSLTLDLCDHGRRYGYRHFFYGGAEGVPERLANCLSRRYPGLNVAGTYSPPFRPLSPEEDEQITRQINDTRPDIVWVGLGAPKQEKWMLQHHGRLRAAAVIGIGAAFDFHSGTVPWAPVWIRRCGLEWVHRLLHDPKRMWRRNLNTPRFLYRVLCQGVGTLLGFGPPHLGRVVRPPSARPSTRTARDRRLGEWCREMARLEPA